MSESNGLGIASISNSIINNYGFRDAKKQEYTLKQEQFIKPELKDKIDIPKSDNGKTNCSLPFIDDSAKTELAQTSFMQPSGVYICCAVKKEIFPDSWMTKDIDAKAIPLTDKEIKRSMELIQNALSKYPDHLLKDNLKNVYIVDKLMFSGVSAGGTNSNDAVYIANSGIENGYTNSSVEQLFHHEFSSILLRNFPQNFNETEWMKNNSLQYNKDGVDAIKNNKDSVKFDPDYIKNGFLSQYGSADMEDDLNTFTENLFKAEDGFWKIVDKNENIKNKVHILIDFLNSLDGSFTEDYFRKISLK